MSSNRYRIEFTSDVPVSVIEDIVFAIYYHAEDSGCFVYKHDDKTTQQTAIEVTRHDRDKIVELTDGQVVETLRIVAKGLGVSVQELLRRASK